MKVIMIEASALVEIFKQLNEIKTGLELVCNEKSFSENWLNNEDLCKLLKISRRTLQDYRNEGKISFSQINAKIYYKMADVQEMMSKHYNQAFKK